MDDTREILRRGRGNFAPAPDAFGRVLDRRDRKARTRRLGAVGAVALIALVAGVFVVRQLQTPPRVLDDGTGPTVFTSSGAIVFAATDLQPGRVDRGLDDPRDLFVGVPGGEPRRIVGADGDGLDQACPAFARDGRTLAFVVRPAAGTGASIAGLAFGPDGRPVGDPFQILEDARGIVGCPGWSATGDHLAFATESDTVRIVGLQGGSVEVPSGDGRSVIAFAWSPRGETLAVLDSGGLRLVPVEGGPATTVWTREGRRLPNEVVWSPDARQLAVSGSVGPWDSCCDGHTPFVDLVPVDGRDVWQVPVVGDPAGDSALLAAWLADGHLLLTLGDRVELVYPSDAMEPVDLSHRVASRLLVSPDQAWVLYVGYDGESYATIIEPLGAGGAVELSPWTLGLYTNTEDLAWQPIRREA